MTAYTLNINVVGKDAASSALQSVGRALEKVAKIAGGILVAHALESVEAKFVEMGQNALGAMVQWGEQLQTLQNLLGTSAEGSSIFATAMNRMGVSVDEGSMGLATLVRNLENSRLTMKQAAEQYTASLD